MLRLYTLEKTLGMKEYPAAGRDDYAAKLFNAGKVLDGWITEEFGDAVELGRRYVEGVTRRFCFGGFGPNVSVHTYEQGSGVDRRLCVILSVLDKRVSKPGIVKKFERYFRELAKSREVSPISGRDDGQACLEHDEF